MQIFIVMGTSILMQMAYHVFLIDWRLAIVMLQAPTWKISLVEVAITTSEPVTSGRDFQMV
jgi:hypothetical protein